MVTDFLDFMGVSSTYEPLAICLCFVFLFYFFMLITKFLISLFGGGKSV